MPNGGSDCCGTCWYNARNGGRAGFGVNDPSLPNRCIIRDLDIRNAFYTYCANHPHRRPLGDPTPIGPVFVVGFEDDPTKKPGPPLMSPTPYGRKVWTASKDTEDVRLHLLDLLREIREAPSEEYPSGACVDETVVWQLGEFKEARAVPDLRRVLTFSTGVSTGPPLRRTRKSLTEAARLALRAIGTPGR